MPTSHPVVVELFTSQGCSDCPPADALLGEVAKQKDVIALTLPVTYWDMLGWKDTFASEDNTARQKSYAKTLGRSGIYTPQIIVNGAADVVGNRRDQVLAAISAHSHDKPVVPVSLQLSQQILRVGIPATDDKTANATIWVMHTLGQAKVNVGEGENRGRQLSYFNIVRDLKAVGLWNGQAVTLDLPRSALCNKPHDGLVVLLQRDRNGQIIGAAMVRKDSVSK